MSQPRFDSAVVVLGMHRSGTSALTGVLRLCGLAVPTTLIPPSEANERGFWESEVVNSMNDTIFEQMGLTWRSLESISASSLDRQASVRVVRQVTQALSGEFAEGIVPLIKDPRICRLLAFWQPALSKLAARTIYPIIVRHPVEIAHSLGRRNDIDFDHALLLWARYYLDAEAATRGKSRAFIAYPDLLDDWRSAIASLHTALGLPFDLDAVDAVAIGQYLSGDLRHKTIPDETVFVQSENIPILADAFRVFSSWARGSAESEADYQCLDEARAQLDQVGPLFSGVVERVRVERKRRSAARALADEAVANLARANQTVEDLGGLSAQLAEVAKEIRRGDAVRELAASQEERFGDFGRRIKKLLNEAGARAQTASDDQKISLGAAHQAITSLASEARERANRSAATIEEILNSVNDHSAIESLIERQAGGFSAIERDVEKLLSSLDDRARLDAALTDALEQATILRQRVAIIEQQEQDARALVRLHLGTIQVRDEGLVALNDQFGAVSDELKTVKRKYRSTQAILAREREALKGFRANLAHAEATVARYRRSYPWQLYMRLSALLSRLRKLSENVIGNPAAKRHERDVALLEQSSLFDRDWYLEAYPDVAASGVEPVRHYLENGWREGRDPGPGFSTTAYLKAHADVAAHGFNPLLHYVEYGHSEGRGAPEHAAPSAKALHPRQDFGPAAPCASFPLSHERVALWQRAGSFETTSALRHMLQSGLVVGKLADEARALAFRGAIDQLASLSGASESAPSPVSADDQPGCAALVDAWYAVRNRLRSRWRRTDDGAPMVVRILQQVDGTPELIGEALVDDDLDMVDAKLINQFFPLLFVFTDVDGLILGWRQLAFPSLCRGGLHHAEFAALVQDQATGEMNVCAVGADMAERLLAIRAGGDTALVANIAIDLAGADGTHPLFQPNFQQWLAMVAQVNVRPLKAGGEGGTEPEHYLADSVQVTCKHARSRAGGTLILGSDMVPSLAALSARSDKGGEDARDSIVSMIVSGEEISQPSLFAHLPASSPAEHHMAFAPNFPILSLGKGTRPKDHVPAYALRAANIRPLSDAELLVPVSPPALGIAAATTPMTWLLWPDAWREQDLLQSLESLAAQSDAGPSSIIFVGSVSEAATALAGRLFDGRVENAAELEQICASIHTPLVGFIGASVILHDRRTAGLLTQLLDDSRNVSASVALVSIERRGKGFLVLPADAGLMTTMHGKYSLPSDQLAASVSMLWRSSWPSSAPPHDLWLTRAEQIANWIDPERAEAGPGVHACSTSVTASYCGQRDVEPAAIAPTPVTAEHNLRIELIVR